MAKAPSGKAKSPRFRNKDSWIGRFQGWYRNADRWELWSLLIGPIMVPFILYQRDLGIASKWTGLALVLLVYYIGYVFTLLLVWDRRVDAEMGRIGRGQLRQKHRDLEWREGTRRGVARAREEAAVRTAEAMMRGQMKAEARRAAKTPGEAEPPDTPPQE